MENFAETAEDRIMEAALPFIQEHCTGRWRNMEYQDRISEASLIFLEDLRTMPLNTGHFLEEYKADLKVKMGELNRRKPSRRYRFCSLDSLFSGKTGEFFDGCRFISSPMVDLSVIEVKEFLRSLPVQDREIIALLLDGYSKSEILDKLKSVLASLSGNGKKFNPFANRGLGIRRRNNSNKAPFSSNKLDNGACLF